LGHDGLLSGDAGRGRRRTTGVTLRACFGLRARARSGDICQTRTANGTAYSAASALGRDRRVRRVGGDTERTGCTRTVGRHGRYHHYPGAPLRGRHKKGTQDQEALGRSRGGFSTKIHARCDGKGRPLGFTLTPGQAHDIKGFTTLLRMIGDKIDALLADKGYDADTVRNALDEINVEAVIPSKSNRKQPPEFDREVYKKRNLIERMFNKLKNWRRIATRYDKTATSFLAFIMIASAKLWMPFVHDA
jgi:transposase